MTSATDSFGTAAYNWDARNRMTGITASGLTASFQYDALGRRINKTINGAVTRFVYDGLNPVQELSATAVTALDRWKLEIRSFLQPS